MSNITLSSASTGLLLSYQWSTTNGTIVGSSTGSTVEVSEPGTYTLRVTDIKGVSDTSSYTVSLGDTPFVNITSLESTFELSTDNPTITLQMSSSGNSPYGWKRDSGSLITGSSYTKTVSIAGTYTAYMRTANGCIGAASVEVTGDPNVNTTAPPKPTGLRIFSFSGSQITIDWDNSAGATSYKIYADNVFLDTSSVSSYTHSGLGYNQRVVYTVSAVRDGYESARCNPVSGTTLGDLEPPTTPEITAIQEVVVSNTYPYTYDKYLVWTASTDNVAVSEYRIYKDGTLFKTVPSTNTNTVIATGTNGDFIAGTWTVRAVDSNNNLSAVSNSWQDGVTGVPSPPTNLVADTYGLDSTWIRVTWAAPSGVSGIQGYRVWRNVDGGGWNMIGTASSTTYIDYETIGGGTHCYKVQAYTSVSVVSDYSNIDCYLMAVCLVEGTLVTLSNGTQVRIEDLLEGDSLRTVEIKDLYDTNIAENLLKWSSDTLILKEGRNTIDHIRSMRAEETILINGGLLEATPMHIQLIRRNRMWMYERIKDVRVGDYLLGHGNNLIKVESVETLNEVKTVYPLSIDKVHNFYANGILTHNVKLTQVDQENGSGLL